MKRNFEKTTRIQRHPKKPIHARVKSPAAGAVAAAASRRLTASVRGSRKAGRGSGSKTSGGVARTVEKMVQIAPNLFMPKGVKPHAPPELVLCNVVPNGDGLYRLEPRTWERFDRVSSGLSRKLGLGNRTDTLRRLIRGGFVGGSRVAPKLYTVNLESYWAHYDRCAEDFNYWSNPKVRAEYWTAI